jgi:putative colanic acid biosynthesis UDP-glucose lipid carrier transferase
VDGVSINNPALETQHFKDLGLIQQYGALLLRVLFLADALLIYASLYVLMPAFGLNWSSRYVTLAILGICVFGVATSFGRLYRSWRLVRLRQEVLEIFGLLTANFGIVFVILLFETRWGGDAVHRKLMAAWYVLSFATIALSRISVRLFLRFYRAGGHDRRYAAFFGATETTRRLQSIFAQHPWMGIDVVGIFDDPGALDHHPDDYKLERIAGDMNDLVALAAAGKVGSIYITLPMQAEKRVKAVIDALADSTVSIYYCPMMTDFGLLNAQWDDIMGHPVVSIVSSPFDGYKRHLKRLEDIVLSVLLLPLIVPPIVLLAIAVKLTSPGPVFYNQTRYGLGGRPFRIRKLRTMYTTDSDDEFVQARQGDARITPLGRFLRKTSLDELPQFFNVLQGQMAIVGPRPAPVKYNEVHRKIIYRYMMRHKIKPGITGLAQVNGCRGETDTIEKTEMRTRFDLQYMNNWSIWLDLRIIFKTIILVAADFLGR